LLGSVIASVTDSPNRMRRRTGFLSHVCPTMIWTPPCRACPKSSNNPAPSLRVHDGVSRAEVWSVWAVSRFSGVSGAFGMVCHTIRTGSRYRRTRGSASSMFIPLGSVGRHRRGMAAKDCPTCPVAADSLELTVMERQPAGAERAFEQHRVTPMCASHQHPTWPEEEPPPTAPPRRPAPQPATCSPGTRR